jgi:hypothetical protein
MPNIYWPQIQGILAPGVRCMANRTVATDEGVFLVDLTDYETVKRLHKVIAAAINGWARDDHGQWRIGHDGKPVPTKGHPMPPGRPLSVENVNTFLIWVDDGMPEGPAIA